MQGVAQKLEAMLDPRPFEKLEPHMHLRREKGMKSETGMRKGESKSVGGASSSSTLGFDPSKTSGLTGFRIWMSDFEQDQ